MDIKIIFHVLAIIAGIFVVAFAASSLHNKIVLLVVFSVIAATFEIAILFLSRPPINTFYFSFPDFFLSKDH